MRRGGWVRGKAEEGRGGEDREEEEKCLQGGSRRCAAVGRGWLEESPAFFLTCSSLNPAVSRGMPSFLMSSPFHGLCPPK